MNCINLSVNGDALNAQPLKPNYGDSKTYISNFLSIFRGMGVYRENGGLTLGRDDYDGGYCITIFNISPNPDVIGSTLIKGGNLRLEIQFGQNLKSTVTLLLYAEFSSLLEIDRARSVSIK
jgi:hypothetical protein